MPTDHCATSIDVLGSCQLGQQKLHAATSPCTILSLLNFIVLVLVALVGWRFQNYTISVFQAHPTIIKVTVASQLAFVVACGIKLGSQTNHSPSWAALLRSIIVFSALLLVASLASLVFLDALPSLGRRCLLVGHRIFMEKLHTSKIKIFPIFATGMLSSSGKYHTSNTFFTVNLPFIKSPLNPLSYLSAIFNLHLKFLEEKLKGKMSFGGETTMFLDLALGWLANLISILEEIVGLKVGDEEKFPLLSPWTQDFADAPIIKGNWPH